jgi:transposase-like protein
VQRARIVLLSAERMAVAEVARRVGVSRPAVWRWQRRFAEEGAAGLERDKTRRPETLPLAVATVSRGGPLDRSGNGRGCGYLAQLGA